MKICICQNVSDKDIIQVMNSGICDRASLMRSLKVGTCCRRCVADINELIEKHSTKLEANKGRLEPVLFMPSEG